MAAGDGGLVVGVAVGLVAVRGGVGAGCGVVCAVVEGCCRGGRVSCVCWLSAAIGC